MSDQQKKTRARVIVSGKVQGVFFRAETERAARQRDLPGWVKNRPDKTVEAEFEGDKDKVDSMINWLRAGSPLSHVEEVKITWKNYKGDFRKFDIRY